MGLFHVKGRGRRRSLLIPTLLLAISLLNLQGFSQASAAPVDQVINPTIIGIDADEIANPMRGQYEWLEQAPQPDGWPVTDIYWRDQLQWARDLEKSPGVYDFSTLEAGLQEAQSRGGRLGFRIMSLCPSCGENLTPSWVPRAADDRPDWNSEGYLSAWENLNAAIGAQYDGDPRLLWVDIAGYGPWGEWYADPADPQVLTDESANRIIDAVTNAFPTTFKLMNVNNPEKYVAHAYAAGNTVGSRTDCFGTPEDILSWVYTPGISANRWQVAPTVVEWCPTAAGFQPGLDQVQLHHVSMLSSSNFSGRVSDRTPEEQEFFKLANKLAGYRYAVKQITLPSVVDAGETVTIPLQWNNAGVAPTYEDWNAQLVLRNGSGDEVASLPLGNLKLKFSGDFLENPTVTIPSGLFSGTYSVGVRVVDPKAYSVPLKLANVGRTATGEYPLASLEIVGTQQVTTSTTAPVPVPGGPGGPGGTGGPGATPPVGVPGPTGIPGSSGSSGSPGSPGADRGFVPATPPTAGKPGAGSGSGDASPATNTSPRTLARTGMDTVDQVLFGANLVLGGFALLWIAHALAPRRNPMLRRRAR